MRETKWWVYENWKVRPKRARIHYGICRYCNHGKGVHRKRRDRGPMIGYSNRWHGPFLDSVEAMDFARGLGRADTHICADCIRYARARVETSRARAPGST